MNIHNTPSPSSTTNSHGYSFPEVNYRSLFDHPVGLPLAVAFQENELSNFASSYPVAVFPPVIWTEDVTGNDILSGVCSVHDFYGMDEKEITKRLQEKIHGSFGDSYVKKESYVAEDGKKNEGFLDLLFLPKSEDNGTRSSTSQTESIMPLCVVVVGHTSEDWWKKVNQGAKYLRTMKGISNGPFCFKEPLPLAIIPLQKTPASTPEFDSRMGVFLCTPREEDTNFRVSLIWHKQCDAVDAVSESFVLLQRLMPYFQTRRSNVYEAEEGSEYLCSNCIEAGVMVLRIYDSRLCPSDRRAGLYLDPNCEDIVGGYVKRMLEISGHATGAPEDAMVFQENVNAPANNARSQVGDPHGRDNFFTVSTDKNLLVIATPFRKGGHVAQHPIDFLPIFEHLESIHQAGYVHGDIRAFSTVFSREEGDQSHLIDFDFSGKAGKDLYPKGYVSNLEDGGRIGFRGKTIEMWHDWYALGRLIFDVHDFPDAEAEDEQHLWYLYLHLFRYWTTLKTYPPAQKIVELKNFLTAAQEKGWKVKATAKFKRVLKGDCHK